MTKTGGIILGVIIAAIVVGLVFYASGNMDWLGNYNATSTVGTSTGNPSTGGNAGGTGQQQPGAPLVTTNTNVAPSDTTAVVSGKVTPNGAFTSYWYEYGTTSSLGKKTSNQLIGSGYASISAPGYITGLAKSTTYYFRLVAQNQYGTVTGAQYSFVTTNGTPPPVGSAPATKTLAATGVSNTTANVNGEVTPNQADTQYWFEYGKTASLGALTSFVSAGNGNAKISAAQSISNLDSGSTYYFRINAQNQFGTTNGAILTFKTTGPPPVVAPSVTTRSATAIGTSTATFNAAVIPNGGVAVYWFEYSTDPSFGSVQSTDQSSAGNGITSIVVSTKASDLNSNTTYYFRAVAQNPLGTVRGDSSTFKTK